LTAIDAVLLPGGSLVVIEWARERFDEATARWCQSRAGTHSDDDWLQDLLREWQESGQPWADFCRAWAESERMHTGAAVLDGLAARFDTVHLSYGPYFFSDLADASEANEQAAIASGQIAATGIRYQGRKR
jgi:hypothetical protein